IKHCRRGGPMLGSAIEIIAPRVLWRYRIKNWQIETGEAEERLIPQLCKRSLCTLDVGAADGTYTVHTLLHSSRVIAFEPRSEAAVRLRQLFKTRLVQVEEVALSDLDGETAMKIPVRSGRLATIEERNNLEGAALFTSVPVKTQRLD